MSDVRKTWPDDTETKKYICIPEGLQLDALETYVNTQWPNTPKQNVLISVERIQITNVYHDERDWATFLIVEKKK